MRSLLVACGLYLSINAATISRNARCGPSFDATCLNSQYGSCCSQYGWCGSTTNYCGTGCQSGFGNCNGRVSSSSISASTRASSTSTRLQTSSTRVSSSSTRSPSPSASQPVSQNARCGANFGGRTCLGSQWGDCCSQYNYCGSTLDYCGPQSCQPKYGRCNPVSSSSTRSSTATSRSTSSSRSSSTSRSSMSSSTPAVSSVSSTPASSPSLSSTPASASSSTPSATPSSSSIESPTPSSSSTIAITSSSLASSSITPSTDASTSTPVVSSTPVTPSVISTSSSTPASSSSLPVPTSCNPGGIQPRFKLLVSGSGTNFDGLYGVQDDSLAPEFITFRDLTLASTFTFDDQCSLVAIQNGNIGNIAPGSTDSPLFFDAAGVVADNGYVPVPCNINMNSLKCVLGTANTFYVCNSDNFLQIAERSPRECGVPTLTPIYTI